MRSRAIRLVMAVLSLALVLTQLSGCGFAERWPLPDDHEAIPEEFYTLPDGSETAMRVVCGRVYVYYGDLSGRMRNGEAGRVIGYLARQDYPDDRGVRIVALKDTDDFIMEADSINFMSPPPMFFRALDTRGEEISAPPYVEPYEMLEGFWSGK